MTNAVHNNISLGLAGGLSLRHDFNLACWSMKRSFVLAWLLLLCAAVQAETVYIRNKPFKGGTRGSGISCQVELTPFAQALGFTVTPCKGGYLVTSDPKSDQGNEICETGVAIVDGNKVAVMTSANGADLVSLNEFCSIVGAKVVPNRQMGTLDVYLQSNSKARAPSLLSKWGSDDNSAKAEDGQGLPEGPGKVCIQYLTAFSLLPPMRDLKEARGFGTRQADFERHRQRLESLMTPECFKETYAEMAEEFKNCRQAAARLSSLPLDQLEACVASNPEMSKKFLKVFSEWELLRATSAKLVHEDVRGETAVVTVDTNLGTETNQPKTSKRMLFRLVRGADGAWKIRGRGK